MSGAALGALGIGCSSTPEDPAVDPLAKEEGFCSALAQAVCNANLVKECYGSDDSSLESDTASCVENAMMSMGAQDFCNPTSAIYRAVNAQACIDAYANAYSDAALGASELEDIAAACHPTLSGNGAKGATCDTDQDCNGSQDFFCVVKAGKGTCQVPVEVDAGRNCEAAADVCSDADFYCDASNCVEKVGVGSTCAADIPCKDDAFCDEMTLKCVARFANGTTCTLDQDCEGLVCDRATGAIEGKCKATRPIATTNGQCDPFLP
jgi:hypothetical protein